MLWQPNATLQARPRAGATKERRLLGVACKRLLGPDLSPRPALARCDPCLRPYGETVPDTFPLLFRPRDAGLLQLNARLVHQGSNDD